MGAVRLDLGFLVRRKRSEVMGVERDETWSWSQSVWEGEKYVRVRNGVCLESEVLNTGRGDGCVFNGWGGEKMPQIMIWFGFTELCALFEKVFLARQNLAWPLAQLSSRVCLGIEKTSLLLARCPLCWSGCPCSFQALGWKLPSLMLSLLPPVDGAARWQAGEHHEHAVCLLIGPWERPDGHLPGHQQSHSQWEGDLGDYWHSA